MSDEWTMPTGGELRPRAGDDGAMPLALAAGLVAALIGGAAWAAIGIFMNLEIGWAAWGIGVLVGGAMALVTRERGRTLALAAALLALVGLMGGKAMAFAGSAGTVADQIQEDSDWMRGMTAWQLYEEEALDPALQEAVAATYAAGDTLSDALWAEMLDAAAVRLEGAAPTENRELALAAAHEMIQGIGLVRGVQMQLSGFDLLWLFLALATAFRIMDTPKPEEALVPAEDPAEDPAEPAREPLV